MKVVLKRKELVFLSVVLLFIQSCVSNLNLVPAESSSEANGIAQAAHAQLHGVELLIEPQAWTGRPEITQRVTPIRVTIINKSNNLLRIRPDFFELIGLNGRKYAALPLYQIMGSVEDSRVVYDGYSPSPTQSFTCDNFSVAPYCAAIYPNLPSYQDTLLIDTTANSRYYKIIVKRKLPTPDMIKMALPDGVLEPNGHVSGFIYFERVSASVKGLKFNANLVSAQEGQLLGNIIVLFVNDRN